MEYIISAIPADIWLLIVTLLIAGLTIAIWGFELKDFIKELMILKAPGDNFINQIKFSFAMISKIPMATPFLIDFTLTAFIVGTFGLSGTVGTGLSLFMSDCISVVIVLYIINRFYYCYRFIIKNIKRYGSRYLIFKLTKFILYTL